MPVSVHTKLLTAFLLVTALFFAMGAVSFRIITGIARQSVLLDEAHRRVDSSRQIEHALAMQLNFTAMALLLRDETTIANVLRENNRFNSTLAQIEEAAPARSATSSSGSGAHQDSVMTTVADIANLIRDDRFDAAMTLQLHNGYPLYTEIEKLVRQVVALEEDEDGGAARERGRGQPAGGRPPDRLPRGLHAAGPASWASSSPGRSSCPCARRTGSSGRWRAATSARPSTFRTVTSSGSWPPA